jgi:hypothetical protein
MRPWSKSEHHAKRCVRESTPTIRAYGHVTTPSTTLWASPLLTLFSVEHTSALDRAVIGNLLVELPSTGRSNRLGGGGGLTALDRNVAENLDSLLREGLRREQCA